MPWNYNKQIAEFMKEIGAEDARKLVALMKEIAIEKEAELKSIANKSYGKGSVLATGFTIVYKYANTTVTIVNATRNNR